MKRNITAIFLVIAIMFGNILLPASAAANPIKMVIGNDSNYAGEEVRIPVSIADNGGFWGIELTIDYDPDVLEYVGFEVGEDFEEQLTFERVDDDDVILFGINNNETDGIITVVTGEADGNTITDNGELFTLIFNIKDDASTSSTEINFGDVAIIETFEAEAEVYVTALTNGMVDILAEGEIGVAKIIDKEYKYGEIITVPVHLESKAANFFSYDFTIEYDADLLTFKEAIIEDKGNGMIATVATATSITGSKTTGIITIVGPGPLQAQQAMMSLFGAETERDIDMTGKLFDLVFEALPVPEDSAVPTTTELVMKEAFATRWGDDENNPPAESLRKTNGTVQISGVFTVDLTISNDPNNPNYWWVQGSGEMKYLRVPTNADYTDVEANLVYDESYILEIYDKDENLVTGDTLVGTGATFVLYKSDTDKKIISEVLVVVYGDISGDGLVDALDATDVLLRGVRAELYPLNDVQLEAANVVQDEFIDALDATDILLNGVRGSALYPIGPTNPSIVTP